MKKNLLVLAMVGVATVLPLQSQAQNAEGVAEQNKYQVVTNSFWDNWFISGGVGASAMFGDGDRAGSFGGRISPTLNLSVGKWFTPGIGARLQFSGLQAKGYSYDANASYVRGAKEDYFKQRNSYVNVHADAMFNLSALLYGYNPERKYELIPFVGGGIYHNFSKPSTQGFALNAGILNRFRISDALDINVELSSMGVEDKFDGEVGGKHGFDAVLSLTAGVTYRFKTRDFKRPAPQLISASELSDMQANIAKMAAENAELKDALHRAENRPAEVKEVMVGGDIAPRTVFFKIGSAKLSSREEMNLSYLAEQMKKYPETKYTVNGYADAATGSAEYNQKLSEKRAQAVVDVLVNKYGVSADRLTVSAKGGVDNFGKEALLNRVVLVESAE